MKKFTYPKEEKLKSRSIIKTLFDEGESIKAYPVLIRYLTIETQTHQVGVSVSKRKFKRAVDRMRIKRQMREAYRINKRCLASSTKKYALMIVYIGKDNGNTEEIHHKVKSLLKRLI